MAVKSSGALSMRYDIGTEMLGTSLGTNLSLRGLSSLAGFSTPDAMSEFYGFSNNRYRITATGSGYLRTVSYSGGLSASVRNGFSMGLWIKNNAPSKRNMNLIAVGNTVYGQPSYSRNDILFRYQASLNRLYVEVYRSNVLRLRRTYPLHDYRNRPYTGITSSTSGWYASNRGVNNGSGFTHLSISVDLTQTTATNAIQVYWMGDQLPYSVSNTNSGIYMGGYYNGDEASVGESLHQAAPSGGSWYGDIDNAWIYPGALGSGVQDAITNVGNKSPMTYFQTNGLTPYVVWQFEANTFPQAGSSLAYRLLRGGTTSFTSY